MNCWEYKRCGKEHHDPEADAPAVCAAATDERFDRINHGTNGGRVCWLIRQIRAERKKKSIAITHCCRCDFFRLVEKQEGLHFFVSM
ncbi:MAG: two-CW domain-containing protein [Nitrospirota bacterium]